jgi:hypothetical protein
MDNLHNVSELLAWYQRVTGIGPPVHDITEDFEEMQDFAEYLNLLQDCLESSYMWRVCLSDDYRRMNHMVCNCLDVIDSYEIALQANEMRFLMRGV